MDDELLAAWARLPAEERACLLCVEEPECVRLIDGGMQMLWAAEIQARQFGCATGPDPFEQAQLPLLATMQFDGFMHKGQKVFKLVKWPNEFHEDPMILANALRFSLQAPHGKRRSPALGVERWHQLLVPAAQSWTAFEMQLAQLVEQLVLRAHKVSPESQKMGESGEMWASRAQADANDDEAPAQAPPAGDGGAAEEMASGGSRALKRARQRERRKLGKALARGEDVDALAAAAGVTVPATKKGPAAMSKQPIVPKAPETTETTPCPVPIQTEEVKPPEAIPRAEAVVKAAPQPPVPQETPAEEEDEDDFPGLCGAEMANRGFGRGRPMGRFSEGPFLGRGMGRGRALAPPPGLQGLHLSGSQRLPATLSRPWMAGPPIPEDEDVTNTPQNAPWPEPQHRWSSIPSLDLPQSTSQRRAWADIDSGSEVSYSELKGGQMSYVPTPKQKWSKTPSPPSSPAGPLMTFGLPDALTLQSLPCSVPSAIGPLGMNPAVKDGPDQNDYVIPVYVTVPIAVAKCCPHCGKHFAEMPPREDLPGG